MTREEELQKELQEINKKKTDERNKRLRGTLGNYVKWEECGIIKYGQISRFGTYEGRDYIIVKKNTTSYIGRTSEIEYFWETKKYDNQLGIEILSTYDYNEDDEVEEIDNINNSIREIDNKINLATLELNKMKIEKQKELKEKQKLCIHEWDSLYPTGIMKDKNTEVEECECYKCGVIGRNC